MTHLEPGQLSPSFLLLDPNNYRFQDMEEFVSSAEDRFHEESVQQRASHRLRREEGILALKGSILKNGFIPVERIVVRPYRYGLGDKWVVIEGNRRLAAVKWILEDYDAGVSIRPSVLESIKELPVVKVEEAGSDEVFRASLMGIRHISSIKQWGGYQRAKLIASMRDNLDLDISAIAESLGLSSQEVNRRYRAFKVLEQMRADEGSSQYAGPTLYPLFHEAISLPNVREWLGWSETDNQFRNEETLQAFYDLVTPSSDQDGNDKPPKITTYIQVRELRDILSRPEAKRILVDPNRPLQEAINIAKQDEYAHLWVTDVSTAIRSLQNMGIQELKDLSEDDAALLKKLSEIVIERLKDHTSLTS
jgi:hypothetical protein